MHTIPLIDLRGKTPVDLCKIEKERAVTLIRSSRSAFGTAGYLASFAALPLGDILAKRWLHKTRNPYAGEVDRYARIIRLPGIYALNLSYEWGCTSGVFKTKKGPKLLRVLDWPFPGLGENVVVARQETEAGECYNATWPGVSGIFQAMAPERFAAALNLAPMRQHGRGIVLDWLKNRRIMFKQHALPPAHLLRQAFETASNYEEAKELLARTPLAVPAIYLLSGIKDNEGCVIERTENDACVRELGSEERVCAANHFVSRLQDTAQGWLPRPIDSHGRAAAIQAFAAQDLSNTHCQWISYPVANPLTRLVMTADASTGRMYLQGMKGAQSVTAPFTLLL